MTITFEPDRGGFPTVAYHPVYGRRELKDANEAVGLNSDWFNTAEEADLHRTEREAQMVVHQNRDVKVGDAVATSGVVRNSVAAQENVDAGRPEPL